MAVLLILTFSVGASVGVLQQKSSNLSKVLKNMDQKEAEPEPVERPSKPKKMKHEKPKEPSEVPEMEAVYYSPEKLAEYAAWRFKGDVEKAVKHLKEKLEKETGIMYEVPASQG